MNQERVGKYILEKRRSLGMTQLQLAQRLGITDRAVSKWENGRSLPDTGIMLELCSVLGISVTELLCAQDSSDGNGAQLLDGRVLELLEEKERNDRRMLGFEIVVGMASLLVLLLSLVLGIVIIYAFPRMEWLGMVSIFVGMAISVVGFVFAAKIEQVAGYYECAECSHRYIPSFKSVIFAMHMGRARYMQCPSCGKKSWQKKVTRKNDD